jgi:outer membrane usher protein FimD/PapC
LFNTTLSYSRDSNNDGLAGIFDYTIQTRRFNATASVLAQSRDYTRIGTDPFFNTRIEGAVSFTMGPITLRYLTSQPYHGTDRTAYAVSYSPRTPSPRLSLVTTLRHVEAEESTTELFFGLNYYFQRDYSFATSVRATEDGHRVTASVQKATPIGEGWGFSAAASQFEDEQGPGHSLRPFVQYNARHATLIADYQSVTAGGETEDSRRLAIQGSVSTVGGEVMFSRPINDAFALVQVDGLENVSVYQSGQFAGKTDSKGRLLIPSLGSYVHNQISVDSRDVPLNFELNRYTKLISPGLRGGAVLDFGARRIQAIAGTLNIRRDGQAEPVRYGEISLLVDGTEVRHPVGQTGEFFIENLEPSTYTLSYFDSSGSCTVLLDIPASDDPIIEMGNLLCVAD